VNKKILKPSWSKIMVSWLLMAFILLAFILLPELKEGALDVIILTAVIVLFQTFVFCAVFYNLPPFGIEITDFHVSGLSSLMSWVRVQIPVADIDTENVNKSFAWLGYYVLKSKSDKKLLVCSFDEEKFNTLINILNAKKRV
jgi:hypothetical protein